jgi:hypothetical protein
VHTTTHDAAKTLRDIMTIIDTLAAISQTDRMATQSEIGEWAEACCHVVHGAGTHGADLYRSYVTWAPSEGLVPCSERLFLRILSDLGIQRGTRGGMRIWRHIALLPGHEVKASTLEQAPAGLDVTHLLPGLRAWVADQCVCDRDAVESAGDLYGDYLDWYRRTGRLGLAAARNLFGAALVLQPGVTKRRILTTDEMGRRKQSTMYCGVQLKASIGTPVAARVAPPALVVPTPAAVPSVDLYPDDI